MQHSNPLKYIITLQLSLIVYIVKSNYFGKVYHATLQPLRIHYYTKIVDIVKSSYSGKIHQTIPLQLIMHCHIRIGQL